MAQAAWYAARYWNTFNGKVGPWLYHRGSIYRWLTPDAAWHWSFDLQTRVPNPENAVQMWAWTGSGWKQSRGYPEPDAGEIAAVSHDVAAPAYWQAQEVFSLAALTAAVLMLLSQERL